MMPRTRRKPARATSGINTFASSVLEGTKHLLFPFFSLAPLHFVLTAESFVSTTYRGGFGVVYEAECREDGRSCAVKEILDIDGEALEEAE